MRGRVLNVIARRYDEAISRVTIEDDAGFFSRSFKIVVIIKDVLRW
jgi:hypothetical protein